ncbi:MAG TPA: PilC/PilY family type IV pilus protein [Steroidobacteraceae bacterium]|nr:PilC/PilY family type IV pilus protein [Steroidobacteraceae bacterium]
MIARRLRTKLLVVIAAMAVGAGTLALADDTEIFVNPNAGTAARPNVLLILDTSTSMQALVTGVRTAYDPTQSYGGDCTAASLYWRVGPGDPPPCGSAQQLPVTSNACSSATDSLGQTGLWTGTLAQWNAANKIWQTPSPTLGSAALECQADTLPNGADVGVRYAADGGTSAYTADSSQQITWPTQSVVTLYSANYLNWYFYSSTTAADTTRLDVVKQAAKTLVSSVAGVNIGLMRFSDGTPGQPDGGAMVVNAIQDVTIGRSSLISAIDGLTADGATPLSASLYEAGQYLAGRNVDYGLTSTVDGSPSPSVPESRSSADASVYASPITAKCQRNYVVMLTDGDPSADPAADTKIQNLPDFSTLGGSCSTSTSDPGRCLAAMARYLRRGDLATSLAGAQSATTYTIGFGPAITGTGLLAATAEAGGGQVFAADNVTALTGAFQRVLGDILQTSSTFTTPSVAVNAFNRTQQLDELYVSVFQPDTHLHWPGNLKKYGIANGTIVDATGAAAIDPSTGFFGDNTKSFWSPALDGSNVQQGGAVSQLPAPSQRHLYTQLSGTTNVDLTAAGNSFEVGNAALSDAVLGTAAGNPTREQLISWARGLDVQDANGDGSTTDTNRFMGDPLHAQPALVTYGGTTASHDDKDAVVFMPTNDGFLHAVNAKTGVELWAFIPQELLGRVADLYRDPVVASRTYGLDGDVRILTFDANQDGVIDASAGDRAWIFFGMRRGGRYYYALDVTDRSHPVLMWKLGAGDLPGLGETWSAPVVTRVKIDGAAQNGENIVLIFGGGYDPVEENVNFTADTSGNRIYMVDAQTGQLLWYAGGPGAVGTPDLALPNMTSSIPARVTVVDTDGDQFADRIYAADMGGRVWRFDIFNNSERSALVTGGVLASLGAADESPATLADTRRFYYAPDVALIQRRGADPYYNVALGSGYRGHPLNTGTHDRFYSIRDKYPFAKLRQSDYDARTPLRESDLVDITSHIANPTVDTTASGWKLELQLNGGWVGEKVLAESLTANGVILFPTYQPVPPATLDPCLPANGQNRVYALQVDTGKPAVDFNHDLQITAADAFARLSQTGIAGSVSLLYASAVTSTTTTGNDTNLAPGTGNTTNVLRDALGRQSVCMVGVEVLNQCVAPGGVVRTFWQHKNTD